MNKQEWMDNTIEPITDPITNHFMVAVGASAGGLEAINELFDNMPANTGFSFIVVQHLSPDYKSLMAELLSKHTKMQVLEAVQDIFVKPNCIYLIPAGKTMTIKNNKLKLDAKLRDHHPNMAIDIFFESLAIDKKEKAVGVILSGTGTDGTKGIEAIKKNGGVIITQDPATAQFDGMPNSAIASGYADLILSPELIADELLEFIKEAPLLRSFSALSLQEESVLQQILEQVFRITGNDFSSYKRPTISRRLARRMTELKFEKFADYFSYLSSNNEEARKLSKEFLLHVTKFFRDIEAFATIKNVVLPDIVSKKQQGDIIKIWTVACSTGEEAYSLAMLLHQQLARSEKEDISVKIFASDIDQEVIEYASKGLYTVDQVSGVPADLLTRFFTRETNNYRVIPEIRKMIVFAKYDITRDPPFSKIDLLTCRNMMIYMNPALQKKVLQKIHFSINDEGYIFLGPSENLGALKDMMVEVDKKWKIYRCVSKSKTVDSEIFANPSQKIFIPTDTILAKSKNALNNITEIFKETLLEEYDYAGIFIDRDFEVKQAIGNFKKFLEFPETVFNFNLLKLVPKSLAVVLSTGIRKAIKDNERVVQKNVKIQDDNTERNLTIIIKPYLLPKVYLQPFIFIILKDEPVIQQKIIKGTLSKSEFTSARIQELEDELGSTKESLQSLIEEVESANEELQTSNEEIVSANEELQSTNEELQSLNEELHTVNAEHQLKIKELIELNDDLNNYFRNTEIGQVLIDRNMLIRKFSPVITKQINMIPGDIGRSILDISTNIKNLDFINDIKSVMQTEQSREKEITMDNGSIFLMRIVPYLRQDKTIEGVVVNFIDISETRKLSTILEAVLNSSTSGIAALQAVRDNGRKIIDFEFISINKTSEQLLGLTSAVIGRRYKEVYGHVDPMVFNKYVSVVETGQTGVFEFLNEKTSRWFEVIVVKMLDGIVVTFNDITDSKTSSEKIRRGYEALQRASDELETTNFKLAQSNLDLLQFASVASHDLKEPLRKIEVFGNLLTERVNEKLDDTEMNYLGKIIKSSNRMQGLIDNILILSRLSMNETPQAMVDINLVIGNIIDDLEISIRDKGVKITIGNLPVVPGITGQIHQLFQNLISNAIKFNEGNPELSVRQGEIPPEMLLEYNLDSDNYVAIFVEDNGIGFDQQFHEKIFGIFQRLNKTNYQGTGIGLAIVKKIVDNHKGFIKAYSCPDKGSRFVVVLPSAVVGQKHHTAETLLTSNREP